MAMANDLTLLDELAGTAGVEWDPTLARLALREAEGGAADATDEEDPAFRRLALAGNDVGLRISVYERRLGEALEAVGLGTPVVVRTRGEHSGESVGVEGDGWLMIRERRGGRVKASRPGMGSGKWMKVSELARRLGVAGEDDPVSWAVFTPISPLVGVAAASGHQHQHQHQPRVDGQGHAHATPLRRLIALLRPEGRDLRAIVAFGIAVGVLSLATPIAVEALVTTVAFGQLLQPILVLSLILLTCLTLAAALKTMQIYLVEMLQRRVFVRVVAELAHRIPKVRRGVFDTEHGPELLNRFFDVLTIQKVSALLWTDGLALILSTLIGLIVLAFYHPLLLGFDLLVVAAMVFTVFQLGRGAIRTSIAESRAKYGVADRLEELARAQLAFKHGGASAFAIERVDGVTRQYLKARSAHFGIVLRQSVFVLGFQALAITALLGLGGWLVILGQLTLGQLVAAELIVATVAASFAKVGKHLEGFYDLLAAMDKIGHLTDLPEEREPPKGSAVPEFVGGEEARPASLRLRHLDFGFGSGHGREIVRNLDLEVAPGESLAILGGDGTGKSAIADLIFGLREPNTGAVELDGIDIRDMKADTLRRHVALVQDVEVIAGSVAENVRMGREWVNPGDVRRSLAAVGLLDTVTHLPEGLHTRLNPIGSPLSHCQTIRLVVARALAGGPRLLVLDGTLDALDEDIKDLLFANLAGHLAPWTLLVTTHDPKAADRLDRCVRLDSAFDPGHQHPPRQLPGLSH